MSGIQGVNSNRLIDVEVKKGVLEDFNYILLPQQKICKINVLRPGRFTAGQIAAFIGLQRLGYLTHKWGKIRGFNFKISPAINSYIEHNLI